MAALPHHSIESRDEHAFVEAITSDAGREIASWRCDDHITPALRGFLLQGRGPFETLGWLEARLGVIRGERPLLVTAVAADGRIVAFFPFAVRQTLGASVLVWAGQGWTDYCGPVLAGELDSVDAACLLRDAIGAAGARPDAIVLRKHLSAQTDGTANGFSLKDAGWRESDRGHVMDLAPDWPRLLASKLGAKSRSTVRRKRRLLSEKGRVATFLVENPVEAHLFAGLMIDWKRAQLKASGAADHFKDPDGLTIIRASILQGRSGRIFALTLDGAPIALMHCLDGSIGQGRTRLLYQTAIAPEAPAQVSPGQLLLHYVLERSCAEGFAHFDFGLGDEPYKSVWADRSPELHALYRVETPRGLAAVAAMKGTAETKRFVKVRPRLFANIKALRARLP